ncbi:stage III sporulation protein AA [Oceanobacillus sp. FSL H7-0719]|uniref:stage III sporulation protein AA n=1 Tax=Oceanobacillus sp. FSL H7-0719 TaxID=2954507 RepID=UPI0032450D3F
MEEILRLFPADFKQMIAEKVGNRWGKLEEIRCRLYLPIELIYENTVEWIHEIPPNNQTGMYLVNQLSEFSLYRMENELRDGYITIEGGHRVGIAGKVNTRGGTVKAIQNITFFNIRIAKQRIGIAEPLMPHLFQRNYLNTLIIGPPQSGKTTLIRDMVRMVSTGWNIHNPRKVAVIDERSEIGAAINGIPQHDLGLRTDVMDACPKAEGMMMMIRSMSPEVLVVDEIGGQQDFDALLEAIYSGVTIFCSVHGQSLADLKEHPLSNNLFENGIFSRYIVLDKRTGSYQKKELYDAEGRRLKVFKD